MGSVVSYLMSWVWSPAADDQNPDPATGLTQRDCQLITETWRMVADKKTIKLNGIELFIQLFRRFPYMQDYFKQFRGASESELRTSPKMRVHALGVMTMVTSYVNNMNDVETLVALVQKVATSHLERKIVESEFEGFAAMMPDYLRSILGDQFTKEAEASWTKFLTTHSAVVAQTMEAIRSSKSKNSS